MSRQAERDRASLERRLEVLKLPVVPLTGHGFVAPADRYRMLDQPEALGVGPDGTAFAVWPGRDDRRQKQVTLHDGGRKVVAVIDLETDLRVSFVQPLPDGRILLVAARARHGADNAEVWSSTGDLERRGHLGDAIEELQTTPAGQVWVGYFDEAMGGPGPEGHGLARFTEELAVDWLYPHGEGLPAIADCYTLNVDDETAHFCPYTDFHLMSASGERVTDWGPSPYKSAGSLLVSHADYALIAGWGPEYDLVTFLRISDDSLHLVGDQRRLVLPDGIETRGLRYTCRGADLHAFSPYGAWYRTTFAALRATS